MINILLKKKLKKKKKKKKKINKIKNSPDQLIESFMHSMISMLLLNKEKQIHN